MMIFVDDNSHEITENHILMDFVTEKNGNINRPSKVTQTVTIYISAHSLE